MDKLGAVRTGSKRRQPRGLALSPSLSTEPLHGLLHQSLVLRPL